METKKWWQSKTLWMGVLVILGGVVEYIAGLPTGVSATTVAVGIINIIFRFLTTQPIGK